VARLPAARGPFSAYDAAGEAQEFPPVERSKSIFLFPTQERTWTVMEEASGQHFAHYADYQQAEAFALELARKRRVRLLVLDGRGIRMRRDFRPWWVRMLFPE
jgi:hypothetical protein